MLTFDNVAESDRIIVALDCDGDEALKIAQDLQGGPRWLKVGMTLYYQEGPHIVRTLKELGYKVFLDLKFFDIPHQVQGAARSAVLSGADMITLHGLGGSEMMRAALKGINEAGRDDVISLAVTILTSMDQNVLASIGIDKALDKEVVNLARIAYESGVSGVVSSPQEAPLLRELLGREAFIVTPGIRPAGSNTDDQKRVTTPREAFDNGSSHLVIGRPITAARNRKEAFDKIVKGL